MTKGEALAFNENKQWREVRDELDKMIVEESALLLACKPEQCKEIQTRINDLKYMTRLPNYLAERDK